MRTLIRKIPPLTRKTTSEALFPLFSGFPPCRAESLFYGQMPFSMVLSYTDTKEFSPAALEELFLSVQWESGRHPERLAEALLHYGTVFSAWDGGRLAGLIAAMDDGTMTAYVHYLLVHPLYQGCGVGSRLLGAVQKALCRVFERGAHLLPRRSAFLRKERLYRGPGRRRPCALFPLLPGKPGFDRRREEEGPPFLWHALAERLHAAHGGGAPQPFQGAVQEEG